MHLPMQNTSVNRNLIPHFWKSLLVLAILTAASLLPTDRLPEAPERLTDKHLHFISYAILTLVLLRDSWKYFRIRSSIKTHRWIIGIVLFCFSWGVLMELCQGFFTTNRNMELLHVVANTIGVILGAALFLSIMKFIRGKKLH